MTNEHYANFENGNKVTKATGYFYQHDTGQKLICKGINIDDVDRIYFTYSNYTELTNQEEKSSFYQSAILIGDELEITIPDSMLEYYGDMTCHIEAKDINKHNTSVYKVLIPVRRRR